MRGLTSLFPKAIGIATLVSALSAGAAFAQSGTGDTPRFPHGGYADRFDDTRNQQQTDFPVAALGAAVTADARATMARAQLDRAYSALNLAVTEAQMTFERSSELTDAMAAEKQAFDDLNAAYRNATAKLMDDPTYVEAGHLRDEMTHRISEKRSALHDQHDGRGAHHPVMLTDEYGFTAGVRVDTDTPRWSSGPHHDEAGIMEVVAMATVKLGYASTVTAMEAVRISEDPAIPAARQRLMDASAKVAVVRQGFADKVRSDPALLALRKSLDDARVNRVVTATVAEDSMAVGDAALDYAYYRLRQNSGYPVNGQVNGQIDLASYPLHLP